MLLGLCEAVLFTKSVSPTPGTLFPPGVPPKVSPACSFLVWRHVNTSSERVLSCLPLSVLVAKLALVIGIGHLDRIFFEGAHYNNVASTGTAQARPFRALSCFD